MKEEKLSDDPLIEKNDSASSIRLEEGKKEDLEPKIKTFFTIPYKTGNLCLSLL